MVLEKKIDNSFLFQCFSNSFNVFSSFEIFWLFCVVFVSDVPRHYFAPGKTIIYYRDIRANPVSIRSASCSSSMVSQSSPLPWPVTSTSQLIRPLRNKLSIRACQDGWAQFSGKRWNLSDAAAAQVWIKGRQENFEVKSNLLRGEKKQKPEHLLKCFCQLDPTRWKQTERRRVTWEDFFTQPASGSAVCTKSKKEKEKKPPAIRAARSASARLQALHAQEGILLTWVFQRGFGKSTTP